MSWEDWEIILGGKTVEVERINLAREARGDVRSRWGSRRLASRAGEGVALA